MIFKFQCVIVIVLGCANLLSGCDKIPASLTSMFDNTSPDQTYNGKKVDVAQWSEEVKLHDGRVVVVQRKIRAFPNGFPNAPRGRDIDTEFAAEFMKLVWKHSIRSNYLRDPISFEIFDNTAFLVLMVGEKQFCDGKPPSDYTIEIVKWVNSQWVAVPVSEFPLGTARTNLHVGYWGRTSKEDAKGLIPWADKKTAGDKGKTVKEYLDRYHRVCEFYQKM